ncbi:MAG: hypothetical protein VX438_17715, partial [Planctomycetota bacterium]|nr:hypothetical protein [Planctomycetota bacterium]
LYGDAGPDVIRGESGNDSMYGGSGLDKIWGGSGLDGMFGGIDNVRDRIYGQTDEDRYLFRENDFLGDRYPNNEAIVHFEDKDDQWTDIEVEAVDQTLRMFHFRLQNTDLIRDTISDEPIVFVKAKYLSGGDEGRNDLIVNRERYYSNKTLRWEERVSYERKIVMADWDETDDALNESRISLTTNLMAKNWDSITELTNADEESNQRWENFLSSSDWTDQYPSDPGSYQLSQDGLWWYGTGSSFAKPGGSLNPSEDWSTVWDYYFTVSPTSFDFGLNQKLNQVDSLFDSMFQT